VTQPALYSPPPQPPASVELRRTGRRALSLALVSVPMSLLAIGIPFALAGSVACAVAAVVLGIRTSSAAQRAGTAGVTTAVVGLTVGALSLLLAGIVTLMLVVFWPELTTLRECMSGANTAIAQQACEKSFVDSVTARTGG
jgi:hypothetical protein